MRRVDDEEAAGPAPRIVAMMCQAHRVGNRELVEELQVQLEVECGIQLRFMGSIPQWKGDFDYEGEG